MRAQLPNRFMPSVRRRCGAADSREENRMPQSIKRVLSVLLCAALLFGAAPLNGFAGLRFSIFDFSRVRSLLGITASAANVIKGTYGVLSYELDEATGWITITGCDKTAAGELVIPKEIDGHTVRAIGNYAFRDCTQLTGLNLDAFRGVKLELNMRILDGCVNVKTFQFQKGWQAYYNETEGVLTGSSVEEISFEQGASRAVKCIASNCAQLKKVNLPDSLKEIGERAFYNCPALESINIPDSVEKIGFQAFANCSALSRFHYPAALKECTTAAQGSRTPAYCGHIFEGCRSLLSITVPEGVERIPDYLFCYADCVDFINLPSSLVEIADYAFYHCSALVDIQLPDGISKIGSYAFAGCGALLSFVAPEALTTIKGYAFSGCEALAAAALNQNIARVESNAFQSCPALKTVYYAGDAAGWAKVALNNNTALKNAALVYQAAPVCMEPDRIVDSHFEPSASLEYDSFFGGILTDEGTTRMLVDLNESSFAENRRHTFISFPAGSTVTYGFTRPLALPERSVLFVTTTGSTQGTASVYLLLESGEKVPAANVQGSAERTAVVIPKVEGIVTGIQILGAGSGSAAPWVDVIRLAIMANEAQPPVPCWGDLNGDGKFDLSDMQKYDRVRRGVETPTQEERCFLDVNLDGKIDDNIAQDLHNPITADLQAMNEYRLGRLYSFPADALAVYDFVPPTKTTYYVGERFDPAGMKVVITNRNNPSVKYELTQGVTVSGFNAFQTGQQTLIASLRGLEYPFTVTVKSLPHVKKVEMSDVTINYKATAQLQPVITADEGAQYTVKYESSVAQIAKVDANGKVTGAMRGTAVITCTATDQTGAAVKGTCRVTVKYTLLQWLIIILLFGWIWY